jgi:hypothetical protein
MPSSKLGQRWDGVTPKDLCNSLGLGEAHWLGELTRP